MNSNRIVRQPSRLKHRLVPRLVILASVSVWWYALLSGLSAVARGGANSQECGPAHRRHTVAIIEAERLSKVFRVAKRRPGVLGGLRSIVDPEVRVVPAVENLSLAIERGEMVGFVGPNGAGKSTTIKMLTGILTPTSGHAHVAGLDPQRQRRDLTARIGVVFGQRSQLWWDLP